jgi:hypothetical protein
MIASKIRLGSIDEDFYVRAVDLARLLKITDNEISRLVRSAVMTRVLDPNNGKAFLYPCLENVRRFVEFHRNKREAIHQEFLREKAGRERATRLKVEMFNRERAGELVDKRRLIARLEPIIAAYREQMLSRADRFERELTRTKSRKEKVRKIRAADMDSLAVLSDLFKRLGKSETASNGARARKTTS